MPGFTIPRVVHTTIEPDGRVVVLNVRTGMWHVLNTTGGMILEELRRSGDVDTALAALQERYPKQSIQDLRVDVEQFVSALLRRDLLQLPGDHMRHADGVLVALPPNESDDLSVRQRVLAVLSMAFAMVLLRFPLRMSVWAATWLKAHWAQRPATVSEGMDAVHAANSARRYFPGRVACLELSLTAVLFAAVTRRSVDWCFGHSSDPVTFHSWIEVNGRPVRHPGDHPVSSTYCRVLLV